MHVGSMVWGPGLLGPSSQGGTQNKDSHFIYFIYLFGLPRWRQ